MLIIEPGTQFLLTQKLNNPSDTNTYYVQAKVYNAVTGSLLSTVNLTDNGNKYFSKLWTAPTDGTVNGLQVIVLTTAYTDSSYTQESTIYGTSVDNYIVRHLPTNNLGGFTTQAGVDYAAIEKIVRKVIKELPQQELPERYDDTNVKSLIGDIADDIEELKAQARSSYAGHGASLTQLAKSLQEALKGNRDRVESLEATVNKHHKEAVQKMDQLDTASAGRHAAHSREVGTLRQDLSKHRDDIADSFKDFRESAQRSFETPVSFEPASFKVTQKLPESTLEKKPNPDDERAMTIKRLLSLSQQS